MSSIVKFHMIAIPINDLDLFEMVYGNDCRKSFQEFSGHKYLHYLVAVDVP